MHVFVYGTLTDPGRAATVVDSFVFVGPAVLDGLHIVDGDYPTLAPGGETAGRLLRTDDVAALDDYEGVADGLYTRVTLPCRGAPDAVDDEVNVYVGDPARLRVADAVEWPGDGSFADRVQSYVDREGITVVARQIP